MGSGASQPAAGIEPAVEDTAFSLSEDLQEKLAQEFGQGRFFGSQIENLKEKKEERTRIAQEASAKLKERMDKFHEQNKQVHENLNASIEKTEASFTDLANSAEYDTERLEKQFVKDYKISSKDIPCLSERNTVATCLAGKNTKEEPAACDLFIDALESCVNKTVTATK